MKSFLAAILVLLLTAASFGTAIHASGADASAMVDVHEVVASDRAEATAGCCDSAGHEMSASCFVCAHLAPPVSGALSPPLAEDVLHPTASPHVTSSGPDAPRKPPRTS